MLIKSRYLLLVSSVVVLPLMVIVFSSTAALFGTEYGYFIGFITYWIYCISIAAIIFKRHNRRFSDVWCFNLKSKRTLIYAILALIPIFGVFYIQFLPNINLLTKSLIILIMSNAIVNGFIEELYWRGLYLLEFKYNDWIGLWFSTIFFGVWHIALYTIPDISYGGFLPLVGGSFFMGLIWSFCARKLNSIAFPTIAHILVNIFAFTGFYIKNGF